MTDRRKYVIDGRLREEDEVRRVFKEGVLSRGDLDLRLRMALDMVGTLAPTGRFLDVGCYSGTLVRAVDDDYPHLRAVGIDSFEDNVAVARLLYPDLADRFRQMSVYSLDFPNESIDCVTMLEVLEHLDRPVDAIREINRVLKSGAYLIVSVPNANADAWKLVLRELRRLSSRLLGRQVRELELSVYFTNMEWNRHIYSWTPVELNTLLTVNGFQYVRHRFCCYSLLQRMIPSMAACQLFLVRKVAMAPRGLV